MRGSCIRVLDYRIRPLKLYEDSGRIPTTRTSGVLTKQPRPRKCKIFSESQVLSGRYALFSLQPTRYAFPTIWDQTNANPSVCCLDALFILTPTGQSIFFFVRHHPIAEQVTTESVAVWQQRPVTPASLYAAGRYISASH